MQTLSSVPCGRWGGHSVPLVENYWSRLKQIEISHWVRIFLSSLSPTSPFPLSSPPLPKLPSPLHLQYLHLSYSLFLTWTGAAALTLTVFLCSLLHSKNQSPHWNHSDLLKMSVLCLKPFGLSHFLRMKAKSFAIWPVLHDQTSVKTPLPHLVPFTLLFFYSLGGLWLHLAYGVLLPETLSSTYSTGWSIVLLYQLEHHFLGKASVTAEKDSGSSCH